MTIADQIRAEVLRVDKVKWQRETLHKHLRLRFRQEPSRKQFDVIEAGTVQQLDLWLERVLTAASIDEVLS